MLTQEVGAFNQQNNLKNNKFKSYFIIIYLRFYYNNPAGYLKALG